MKLDDRCWNPKPTKKEKSYNVTMYDAVGQYINLYSTYDDTVWYDVYIIINEPNDELSHDAINEIERIAREMLNLSIDMMEDKKEAKLNLEKALDKSTLIPCGFQLIFETWGYL